MRSNEVLQLHKWQGVFKLSGSRCKNNYVSPLSDHQGLNYFSNVTDEVFSSLDDNTR